MKKDLNETVASDKCECAELRREVQALRWQLERVDEQARISAGEIGRLIGILEKLTGAVDA